MTKPPRRLPAGQARKEHVLSNIIKIGNQELAPKELRGQRVVTFRDIDLVHERPEGTAKRNFAANQERFIETEDYHRMSYSEFSTNFVPNQSKGGNPNNDVILITEQGYLMLVKSFTDDLAWKVQRDLVNTYFKVKKPLSAIEQLQLTQQAILEVKADVDTVNQDLQSFKMDMPILGIECDRITAAVKKKGVNCLGGKDSNAYQDSSLRGRVYSDIYGQLKREFGLTSYKAIKRCQTDKTVAIIEAYELPFTLEEEINDLNAQMVM
ncbi:MAG: hypothetical protein K0Q87_4209 [Neobacillus sp.]|jgi:hypothetical protein|nr:hypothetical protein [Neobacillus sp.]